MVRNILFYIRLTTHGTQRKVSRPALLIATLVTCRNSRHSVWYCIEDSEGNAASRFFCWFRTLASPWKGGPAYRPVTIVPMCHRCSNGWLEEDTWIHTSFIGEPYKKQ